MANAPTKPTTPVKKEESASSSGLFATLTIPICIVIAILLFMFVLGNPSNFEGGDVEKGTAANFFGIIHKGGNLVPLIMSYLLIVIVFSIERFIVIGKASGTSSIDAFVRKIISLLNAGNIDAATAECDKQKGSVANVIKAGLKKYKEMEAEGLDVDQSTLAIQKDIEEATALEMPMLEQNLTIIATLVSIGTLTGLLGTVFGMIGAFQNLAKSGAASQTALSANISEALVNTALGISTSAISIVMYNVFTSKIDKLTYAIDETGFSIVQTFGASHKHSK